MRQGYLIPGQNSELLKRGQKVKGENFSEEFASQPKYGLNVLGWSLAPLFKKKRDINVRASRPFLLLDKDTHDLLKQRLEDLGGVSFADFVKDSLGLLQLKMPDIEEIKDRAWNEGYDEAEKECQIWYYCAVCRKRIDIDPNDNAHKAIIGYMKDKGWAHASCHKH